MKDFPRRKHGKDLGNLKIEPACFNQITWSLKYEEHNKVRKQQVVTHQEKGQTSKILKFNLINSIEISWNMQVFQ